jgi:hypothetical protein
MTGFRTRASVNNVVTVHVPMTFKICGGRKEIISAEPHNSGEEAKATDEFPHVPHQLRTHNALIKALARAHRWHRMIENGDYCSITELAKAEDVNESYACRVLRLTLLAPAIVTDILDGQNNPDLMLKRLMKPLPVRWDEQMAVLGKA